MSFQDIMIGLGIVVVVVGLFSGFRARRRSKGGSKTGRKRGGGNGDKRI